MQVVDRDHRAERHVAHPRRAARRAPVPPAGHLREGPGVEVVVDVAMVAFAEQQRIARAIQDVRHPVVAVHVENAVAGGVGRMVGLHAAVAAVAGHPELPAVVVHGDLGRQVVGGADQHVQDRGGPAGQDVLPGIIEIPRRRQGPLLDLGQDQHEQRNVAVLGRIRLAGRRGPIESAGGKHAVRIVIVLRRQGELLQVVDATGPPGRLAGRLDRRQQQRDQDADNGNHHQQFDQRKRLAHSS